MRVVQMSTYPNMRINPLQSPPPQILPQSPPPKEIPQPERNTGFNFREIISNFEKDDYILAGILIALIAEGCDDYILLAALGYLFVMGILPQKEH